MSTVDSPQSSDHLGDRVYISSSARDLKETRKCVIDVVQRSGYEPVAMEDYGADTRPPLDRCLRDVRSCAIYIGIVAWRYGSCPPRENKSFTHREWEEAARHGKDILLFHLDEDALWPHTHDDDSKRNVRKLRGLQAKDHTVYNFFDTDDLVGAVRKGLREFHGTVGAPVPELLPYTVDRDTQKESFAAAAERGDLDHSPALVVIHGSADQSQGKFVDYMREQLLPRHLGADTIHHSTIGLRAEEFDHPDTMTRRIASKCHLAPTADIDMLSRQLYESGMITALWFPVEVEVRRGRPRARQITQLLEYFARWPPDQSLRVLPIISAEHEQVKGWQNRLPWRVTASQDRFDRSIEQAVATATANSGAVVLPKLTDIERTQVTAWTDQPEVRRRLGPDSAPEIRSIFQTYERSTKKRGIPMDELAPKLIDLLDDIP